METYHKEIEEVEEREEKKQKTGMGEEVGSTMVKIPSFAINAESQESVDNFEHMYQEITEFGDWEVFDDVEVWKRIWFDCVREIETCGILIERKDSEEPIVTRVFQVLKVRNDQT